MVSWSTASRQDSMGGEACSGGSFHLIVEWKKSVEKRQQDGELPPPNRSHNLMFPELSQITPPAGDQAPPNKKTPAFRGFNSYISHSDHLM